MAVAAVLVVAGAGCATQKKAAQSAIDSADSSLKAVAADAQAYVPDLYSTVEAELTAARTDFDAAKYADALAEADSASAQVAALGSAISAKKNELTASWNAASDSLPGILKAIQARVDELGKARRLPTGVTKAAVDGAKEALEEMNNAWSQAQSAYGSGKVAEAVQQADAIKGRAGETMASLGMKK